LEGIDKSDKNSDLLAADQTTLTVSVYIIVLTFDFFKENS
jgi:hypothetical protein